MGTIEWRQCFLLPVPFFVSDPFQGFPELGHPTNASMTPKSRDESRDKRSVPCNKHSVEEIQSRGITGISPICLLQQMDGVVFAQSSESDLVKGNQGRLNKTESLMRLRFGLFDYLH